MFSDIFGLSDQKFHTFQLFLRCFLAETYTDTGDWDAKSNRESGDGFSDILIKPENPDLGIVIEVKYAKEFKGLDAACDAAMAQIKQKGYDETLRDEGRCDILAYGIAFCRKRCRVVGEKL